MPARRSIGAPMAIWQHWGSPSCPLRVSQGNCMYAAIATLLAAARFGPTHHAVVRAEVVDAMKRCTPDLQPLWDRMTSKGQPCASWAAYLQEAAQAGTWGGDLELLTASAWSLTIVVVRPGLPTTVIGESRRMLWLKYTASHYKALRTTDDTATKAARR